MQYSYVYILTNKKNGTLYTGVTSDLLKRMAQHRQKMAKGFTYKYNLSRLVHYIIQEDIEEAILLEKKIKRWHRSWKIALIEEDNPNWDDLYDKISL